MQHKYTKPFIKRENLPQQICNYPQKSVMDILPHECKFYKETFLNVEALALQTDIFKTRLLKHGRLHVKED